MPPSRVMIDSKAGRAWPTWLIWGFAVLPLMGFWATGLFDLDEGFYAAVVREMLVRHDWITPHYNGVPWFEKPILLYWLAAPSVALFGEMVGPRLPSVLCTIGLYFGVWSCTRRELGRLAGDLALLFLSGSLLVVGVGRLMMTDLPLVFGEIMAFLCFWRSLSEGVRWRWLAAFFLGLSVLAKGPVGGAFFLLLIGITYWREPHLRPGFRGGWLVGSLIFLAVVSSWYVPAYLANGKVFVDEFLIKQNIGRFAGGDVAHTTQGVTGLLYYFPIIILGTLPWILKLKKSWPRGREVEDAYVRFAFRWAWIIFVFFTVSGAKLVHYVLPVVPGLAILIAATVAKEWQAKGHQELDWQVARSPVITSIVVFLVANAGMSWAYRNGGWYGRQLMPPHEELHDLTRIARDSGLPIVVYQMSRREADLGTGGTKLKETSHPTIVFYADKPVEFAEKPSELVGDRRAKMVLSRPDRLTPETRSIFSANGFSLEEIPLNRSPRFYALWRLIPETLPGTAGR